MGRYKEKRHYEKWRISDLKKLDRFTRKGHDIVYMETTNVWFKDHLLPELKSGSVIVMDNAAFHKSQETRDIIRAAGCFVLFLPPYSPHLNPIEKLWANIKRAWKYDTSHSLSHSLVSLDFIWN